MEDNFMSIRAKLFNLFISLTGIVFLCTGTAFANGGVKLYTPYTKISVQPGASIDYAIDVINKSTEMKNVDISISGIPGNWTYDLKSGGWNIGQVSILPDEKKTINLKVNVPLKVNKGSYRFRVIAGESDILPLTVVVSEQGTYKTEFTTQQANMEGAANSTFTFQATLRNSTGDEQLYALMADVPRGWNINFKANYKQVTSVTIAANSSTEVTIEVDPPDVLESGKYQIPVRATTSSTSANLNLEVVITGSYKMELTTPLGLLSTEITAGDQKRVELLVRNTGSAELKDVKLEFSAPANWDVIFDPKSITSLKAGDAAKVFATIKADKKAIAGDYVTNLDAKTPEVTARTAFRVSVKTPMLWGWVGIFIIIAALGSVYYLFRKYGRR
jgi:uncharacterized membrane protein